jgi:hypothetical protein
VSQLIFFPITSHLLKLLMCGFSKKKPLMRGDWEQGHPWCFCQVAVLSQPSRRHVAQMAVRDWLSQWLPDA